MKIQSAGKAMAAVIVALLASAFMYAQPGLQNIASADPKKQSENNVRTVNDLKTGNWQNVLSSFLQLSFTDLAGDNKALNFKAGLFALKAKADTNLLLDYNYVRQKFARNFQFDFSLKLDTGYRFKGLQAGFTWAIINKRDSTVVSFANTALDNYYSASQEALQTAAVMFRNSLLDSGGNIPANKQALFNEVKTKISKVLDEKSFAPKSSYPTEFQSFLDDSYNKDLVIADSLYAKELAKLRIAPLLTFSANSTFQNKDRAFSNGGARLVYLQGIKTRRTKTELDIRSSFTIKDTLVINTQRRSTINTSAGINFALLESGSGKSLVEFKPYFEYNSILSKLYAGEKKDVFMANADLRIRIFENFWLPFTLKYDLDKGRFFGFLDVEFNFGAFKKQK